MREKNYTFFFVLVPELVSSDVFFSRHLDSCMEREGGAHNEGIPTSVQ